jgi:hypothetical protein
MMIERDFGKRNNQLSPIYKVALGLLVGTKLLSVAVHGGKEEDVTHPVDPAYEEPTNAADVYTLNDFDSEDNRTFNVHANGSDWVIETSGDQDVTIEAGSTLLKTGVEVVQIVQPSQMNIPDIPPEAISEVFGEFAGLEDPNIVQAGQTVELPEMIWVDPAN